MTSSKYILLLASALTAFASASLSSEQDSGLSFNDERSIVRRLDSKSNVTFEYAVLPLDHFGDCSQTFRNRFVVADQYYKPGGPIILIDFGEMGISEDYAKILLAKENNTSTAWTRTMKELNGMGIYWEHRFYGESVPEFLSPNSTSGFSARDLVDLSVEQALLDVAVFASNFSSPKYPDEDLTPASRPWIHIGGSYAGYRAAAMRKHYPNTIYASWAGSAPVRTRLTFPGYWTTAIWQRVRRTSQSGCVADVGAAIKHIDELLSHKKSAARLKQRFFGKGAERIPNASFASSLLLVYQSRRIYRDYSQEESSKAIETLNDEWNFVNFCDWLEKDPKTNQTAPSTGWAATRGVDYTLKRWQSWKPFLDNVNTWADCKGPSAEKEGSNGCFWDVTQPELDHDHIMWLWQVCTQFGAFQTGGPTGKYMASKYISLDGYWQPRCHKLFPEAAKQGFLPGLPDVESYNNVAGGWAINPTNVFWTSGELDEWRPLTRFSMAAGNLSATDTPPKCNEALPLADGQIFGYVLRNGTHTQELSSGREASKAQTIWIKALKDWLPCFEKKTADAIMPKVCGTRST